MRFNRRIDRVANRGLERAHPLLLRGAALGWRVLRPLLRWFFLGLALADRHWRVREMAAKVVARHGITRLAAETSVLVDDPNHRVRAAAARALRAVNPGAGRGDQVPTCPDEEDQSPRGR